MKLMKKSVMKSMSYTLLIGLLIICLVFAGSVYFSANAATETSDLHFTLINNGTEYKVSASNKNLTSAIIPSEYNNLPVTEIADNGFMMCRSLEQIFVPSSVKKIGNNAFTNDTSLKKVLGMSGVTSYGNNAFSMCSNLDYLILPANLTYLGTSVVKNVNSTIYARLSEEEMLKLNPNWNYGGNIIYGNSIVFVDYPSSENKQGYAVAGWQNLEPSDEPLVLYSWCYKDANDNEGAQLLNIAAGAFLNYEVPSITVKHPTGYDSVHSINIEPYAFSYTCTEEISLETAVTFNANESGYEPGDSVFYASEAQTITFSKGVEIVSKLMFGDCLNLSNINFLCDDNATNCLLDVVEIHSQAFKDCISLSHLEIPNTIEYIGENAFEGWGSGEKEQYISIAAFEEIVIEKNWDSLWNNDVSCEIEFTAAEELTVKLIFEQDGVIGATEFVILMVQRDKCLSDLEIPMPTSTSHNFTEKWYETASREDGTEVDVNKPIKSNLILYAGWSIKVFKVIFPQDDSCHLYDINNGECLDSQLKLFDYGTEYAFYIELQEGYDEIHIYSNDELLVPITGYVYRIVIVDDIKLSVIYKLHEYSITYVNLRGGTNPNADITTFTVKSKIEFKNPSWDAYNDGHWNIPYIDEGSTGDRIVQAIWAEPVEFTISFIMDSDPNAINPYGEDKLKYTVEDTVILMNPSSPGYESGAWQLNGETISGWVADTYWEDMALHVLWDGRREFNVSFDLNGGSDNSTSITVKYGDYLLAKAKPSRSRYKFLGYFYNGVEYYDENMNSVRQWYNPNDGTLTANWEQVEFTIIFQQKNGTGIGGPTTLTLYKEEGALLPSKISMPTRKGYSIKGFYDQYQIENCRVYNADGTFNSQNTVTKRTVTKDMTLFCYWEIEDYYYFVIEQYNSYTEIATKVDSPTLPYDGKYEYTAPETNTSTSQSAGSATRGFTKWQVALNGLYYFAVDFSTELKLSFSVKTVIEEHFPNYSSSDNIYFRAVYDQNNCIAEGALITLADGSQKAVEELTGNESLLVWNLITGSFDTAPILFTDSEPMREFDIINLGFSDGTCVKVISEHGFWDFDLNKYVYLDKDAAQYFGHWFNKQITDEQGQLSWTKVKLVDVTITKENTMAWSPVTYSHLCYYVNGMLSMPGGISGLFNIFEVDNETMMLDEAKYYSDIEQYGLFTYEEFAEIVPVSEEVFTAFNGQYLKVAICKGLVDIDRLRELVEQYAKFL